MQNAARITLMMGVLASGSSIWAKTALPDDETTVKEASISAPLSRAEQKLKENVLEVQLESGGLFSVHPGNETSDATYLPQLVSLNWNLDEIGNDHVLGGWFRGNTQWKFTAVATPLVDSQENYFAGLVAGPQYNFVQPGSNWVPFVGARVGIGFTDSNSPPAGVFPGGQGQDFAFTFMVTVGIRYFITPDWSAAVELNYQHVSNAALSEPKHNNHGYDLLGPQLAVIYAFN
jgi:opacity protein-like surface antigen